MPKGCCLGTSCYTGVDYEATAIATLRKYSDIDVSDEQIVSGPLASLHYCPVESVLGLLIPRPLSSEYRSIDELPQHQSTGAREQDNFILRISNLKS